jgi:hypothetical protein
MPRYDDPQYTNVREIVVPNTAGAAGVNKFALYSAVTLKRARAVVKTAGTSATTGSYIDVMVDGTTTAGRLLTGSATAGAIVDVSLGNTPVAAGSIIHLLNGTDATNAALVTIEYNATPV